MNRRGFWDDPIDFRTPPPSWPDADLWLVRAYAAAGVAEAQAEMRRRAEAAAARNRHAEAE